MSRNHNSHGQELDGTGDIKPTPFDAHEQVVRGHHTHSAKDGYQPAEYEFQEFPKAEAPADPEPPEAA